MVIVGPLLSVAVVTISYLQVVPLAGWIILPSLVWLAIVHCPLHQPVALEWSRTAISSRIQSRVVSCVRAAPFGILIYFRLLGTADMG